MSEEAAPPGSADAPGPRRRWRRPAVLLALGLDLAVVVVAIVLLANGGSLVILAIAAILAIAPWAAIIDDAERPRRR